MTSSSPEPKQFRSFISYSQKDKAWGKRIHTWLETYRVPVGVIADIEPDRHLGRFFRDEEEMPAADNIATVVTRAIKSADSQIVICSPNSAKSKWVDAEIRHFRASNPEGKVFALIIDGTPNSGDPETECFPVPLRAGIDPQNPHAMPIEPMGLDVRIDGKDRVCARLAAGLLNVDFDDLWQRDRRRAEQRQRRAVLTLAALSLVFAALAGAAVWFGIAAGRQAEIAAARGAEADAARRHLQREYLSMLGETAITEVLRRSADPGALEMGDTESWIVLMQRRDLVFAAARDYGDGRVLAVAHDGILKGPASARGDGFLRRTLAWLKGPSGAQRVVISAGHCEWLPHDAPNWRLPALMRDWGHEVVVTETALDDETLAQAGVLIVGNAWGDFSDDEIAAVERFVRRGGGVLAVGLGWSWAQDGALEDMKCEGMNALQNVDDLATYPMNRLAQPFGVRWTLD
jgi:broad specificity phosphatase PhoE